MYPENAAWIREHLERLPLGPGDRALDVGSQTLHYRTVEQPHVEREVMAPLRRLGVTITHLDAKHGEGVDVTCDLDFAGPELGERLGRFELVLFVGILAYVRSPDHVTELVSGLVAPGGWLVVTTPSRYRRTLDPRDNILRPAPDELAAMFERHGLESEAQASLRIDGSQYYRGLLSRASWLPVRGRWWLPLPGFSERLRYRVPALRWRESCVLMRRPSPGR